MVQTCNPSTSDQLGLDCITLKDEKAGQAWVMVPACNPTSEDRQMNCSDLQPAQTSAEIPLISPPTPHTEKITYKAWWWEL